MLVPSYQLDIGGVHGLLERDGGDWSHGRRKLELLITFLKGGGLRSRDEVISKGPLVIVKNKE